MRSLILDPSKSATGWVIYEAGGVIVDSGCFTIKRDNSKKATQRHQDEMRKYTFFLKELIEKYDIEEIISEQPHGSQSATAAWAMSMVVSIIVAVSFCELGKAPIFYLESTVKKSYFNKRKVEKEETREAMNKLWGHRGYFPRLRGSKVVIRDDEAVSDALLVLTHHLTT